MSPTFSPISLGGIPKATVTGTTGSPSIDTSSRPGKTIYNFTGSGSITVGTGGTCEIMVLGGGATGGGGSNNGGGGGGAGGLLYDIDAYLPSGTLSVIVGAGGVSTSRPGTNGNSSRLGSYYGVGGGAGGGDAFELISTAIGTGSANTIPSTRIRTDAVLTVSSPSRSCPGRSRSWRTADSSARPAVRSV
jgi:hypothetical protein